MPDIAGMRDETWRYGRARQDRMHKANVRTNREVQGWRDPRGGGVVELPQYCQHAWQLRDGSYVLTDDPNFDPGRDIGMAGKEPRAHARPSARALRAARYSVRLRASGGLRAK
jgi:hypothetical protein